MKTKRRCWKRTPGLRLEVLEPRCLLSAFHGGSSGLDEWNVSAAFLDQEVGPSPRFELAGSVAPASAALFVPQGATYPLSAIPALHSNPAAAAKLFLDFDGAPAQAWGFYNASATPAYDQDGDPATFSDAELNAIRTIWDDVAEAYSPFQVDVTTVDPGNLADLETLAVVIGGNGAWSGGTDGGLSYVGSFYNIRPNVAFVFSANLSGVVAWTADVAVHESGHAFGLYHQSSYDANGVLISEYNSGDALRAPIMGSAYSAARGLWWYGPTPVGPDDYQDDLAVLTDGRNGWTYRADDHGDTGDAADAMAVSGNALSAAGIIENSSDRDFFSFATEGGTVTLTGNVAAIGAMLDLRLDLYTEAGVLVASADTASLGETITATVAAGSYRLAVASHGSYGDLGQYTISGTVVTAVPVAPDAPGTPQATAVSTSQIDVTWADVAGETSYGIERSPDGTSGWTQVGTLPADVLVFHDSGLAAGTRYYYRVFAANAAGSSPPSAVVSATTVASLPAAPTNLRATKVTRNSVTLAWNDNAANETGFKIERSKNGTTWTQIGTVQADVQTYTNSGLSRRTTYYYRVRAYNAAGDSDFTNVLQLKTAA